MLLSSFTFLALSASALATPAVSAEQGINQQLIRRAGSETSSSFLANILGLASGNCTASCNVATQDYTQCANQSSQATVASCACSAQSLGDLRTCSSCIVQSGNATIKNAVVTNYNSFVDLCVQDGLATVTGTVAVGQSTSAIPRTTAASATSTASRATYTTGGSSTSVASVPTLVGSNSSSPSTTTTAASGASSTAAGSAGAAQTGSSSGAGRFAVSGGVIAFVAVAMSLLA